jgi:bifunctional DNase/RNase
MNVEIQGVRVETDLPRPHPVVLLAPPDAAEWFPVYVGFEEARAIVRGIDAVDIGRPLTHDLLLNVVEAFGGRLDDVAVTEQVEETYLADVAFDTPLGAVTVDARPSDAIALAARTGTALSVDDDLYERERKHRENFADLDDIREMIR